MLGLVVEYGAKDRPFFELPVCANVPKKIVHRVHSMMTADRSLDQKKQQIWFSTISDMGNPFLVSKMKKNDILLLFYSLKSGSSCQYIGTEQLRDTPIIVYYS